MAGKVDWLARNLAVEGTDAVRRTIGRYLRNDVVTVGPTELIAEVRDRVRRSAYGFALATTDGGVLLGRLRGSRLDGPEPTAVANDVMEPGPSTLRPHELAADIQTRLDSKGLSYAIVTDPDGQRPR